MAKRRQRQIQLAQNFLTDASLVRRLVSMSGIGPADTVYEIGPGRGIITAELARMANCVVAAEKDPVLANGLRRRFGERGNVRIVMGDFLDLRLLALEYKVFANIPFNLTAAIVRKILYERPQPKEAYLIMQREPARKFSGRPAETLFSLQAKPYVEFRTLRHLKRTDFHPVPAVDSVLLAIVRREEPLIARDDAGLYREFVRVGFGRAKPHLKSAFRHVFTYTQWRRIARDLHFPIKATPTQLSFEQWLGVFRAFKHLRCRRPTGTLATGRVVVGK